MTSEVVAKFAKTPFSPVLRTTAFRKFSKTWKRYFCRRRFLRKLANIATTSSVKWSAIAPLACSAIFLAAGLQLNEITSQAQVSAASINGAARDGTGALIPSAAVLLRNTETGVETRVPQLMSKAST